MSRTVQKPRSILMVLALMLSACSSSFKHASQSYNSSRLFPDGTYSHDVRLTLPPREGSTEKHFSFNGVVRIKPESIEVVGLSFLGMTAFRIFENRKNGEIKSEIYFEPMRKHEAKLKLYYQILREVLLVGSQSNLAADKIKVITFNERGLPTEIVTVGLDKNADFKLGRFDERGIPAQFSIEHPNFKVEVTVTSYEI